MVSLFSVDGVRHEGHAYTQTQTHIHIVHLSVMHCQYTCIKTKEYKY